MKVNPIGIQSYQQLERREKPAFPTPDNARAAGSEPAVSISPQEVGTTSKLAVQAAKGDYSEILTPEERAALELLFRRFNDTARFGPAYERSPAESGAHEPVGRIVDVKV